MNYSALTNKTVASAYRGFGRPEATFVMESLLDAVASELKLDPAEVRLRNFIQPEQFPYRSATGITYDNGNYPLCLRSGIKLAESWGQLDQSEEKHPGNQYTGVGMAFCIDTSGAPTAPGAGSSHRMNEMLTVRFDTSGNAIILTGLAPHGQGIETLLVDLLARSLYLKPDRIKVVYGDTDVTPYGPGTSASRSAVVASGAISKAVELILSKGCKIVAAHLGVIEDFVYFDEGTFRIHQHPGKSLSINDLIKISSVVTGLSTDVEGGLNVTVEYLQENPAVSYSLHMAKVIVDLDTGFTKVIRYILFDDCGRIINSQIVDGQLEGGIAQGIGGSLFESVLYDEDGQLLTTNFLDYLIPTSRDIPNIQLGHMETPSPTNPMGVKGVGEIGIIGSYAAIANAVSDALTPFGIRVSEIPIPLILGKNLNQRTPK